MRDITVTRPGQDELTRRGVLDWPVWEKEVSRFSWTYDSDEVCYIIAGEVTITPSDARAPVTLKAGDLAVLPSGMTCVWDITADLRKHYNFC